MHSDLLGKAATLINGIKPERSHCLTVNVLFIYHISSEQHTCTEEAANHLFSQQNVGTVYLKGPTFCETMNKTYLTRASATHRTYNNLGAVEYFKKTQDRRLSYIHVMVLLKL